VTGVPVGGNTVVDWQRTMDVDVDLVAGDDLPLAHVDVGLALDPVYLLGLDVEVLLAVERSLDRRFLDNSMLFVSDQCQLWTLAMWGRKVSVRF